MSDPPARPRVLLVGGTGGLVGRALRAEFRESWQIRSVHPNAAPGESGPGIEWIAQAIGPQTDWRPLLEGIDLVVNVAWYRSGGRRRFERLAQGLLGLIEASTRAGVHRFVHLSVPDAPPALETGLPYLSEKRRVDRSVERSGLDYHILRPTMLYGPSDRLLTVMLRAMRRYGTFPMFGDGEYHVSPLASTDLARIVRHELDRGGSRNVVLGGPIRWRYRDLTDRMWHALGRPPRYLHLSPRSSRAVGSLLERVGSTLLYRYEVDWLLSDMLGVPAYGDLDRPLESVEPFLDREGARGRRRLNLDRRERLRTT
ncbi:MAG: SDR family oxidoreductase [Thermoplasmata archaeon]